MIKLSEQVEEANLKAFLMNPANIFLLTYFKQNNDLTDCVHNEPTKRIVADMVRDLKYRSMF